MVVGDGRYVFPLINLGNNLTTLPKIELSNVVNRFNLEGKVLNNILTYNGQELTKGTITSPVQLLYYFDQNGVITFTQGACVNSFDCPGSFKILMNARLVKLFRLFQDESVEVSIAFDQTSSNDIQTKISFITDNVEIYAILTNDESLLNKVPASIIRERGSKLYPYSIEINKKEFLSSILRLLVFNKEGTYYAKITFNGKSAQIQPLSTETVETLSYVSSSNGEINYECTLDLMDLKNTLDAYQSDFISMYFGDGAAVCLVFGNIKTIIPECSNV